MSRWSATGLPVGLAKLAVVLIGLLAAVPVGRATQPEEVRLGDLAFLDQLTNPCQIVRTGDPLSPSGRQDRRSDAELQVELSIAQRIAGYVRELSGVPECNGIHLDSLARIPRISGLSRRSAMREMFRVFLSDAAHLYLMAQEIRESHHTCGNESRELVGELDTLAGRLQNILCVISKNVPAIELEPNASSVSDITLTKYRDCQRRLIRNCLVLQNTSDMLSLSLRYMGTATEARGNFLQPRLMIG